MMGAGHLQLQIRHKNTAIAQLLFSKIYRQVLIPAVKAIAKGKFLLMWQLTGESKPGFQGIVPAQGKMGIVKACIENQPVRNGILTLKISLV